MYLYIEFIDVVANAFIQLLDASDGINKEILYSDLDDYASDVMKRLCEKPNITVAIYKVSNESIRALFTDYSDYFEEYMDSNGAKGVRLKSSDNLWERFIAPLSYEVMMAFQETKLIIKRK